MEVTLETESRKIDGVPHSALRFEYGDPNAFLEISFHRTVRVPDSGSSYGLPPDHDPFPLYSVRKFEETLPADVVAKGGCFLPIYQREAMWMYFEASHPFAVKVCVGGINAVSGEPVKENIGTIIRQKTKLSQGKSIQDYVVAGPQRWLDGVATHDGSVRQFVATPMGSGYSVEAQMTGTESFAGLQLEVVPLKNHSHSRIKIKVIGVDSTPGSFVYFILKPSAPLSKVMRSYCQTEQKAYERVRFLYDGSSIREEDTCESLEMQSGDVIIVHPVQTGGGGFESRGARGYPKDRKPATTMSIAAGGLIKQSIAEDIYPAEDWDTENSIIANVQLINSAVFESFTGLKPPPTPITAATYAKTGFPYFSIYEEPTGIHGKFEGLKSVGELDKENRFQIALHKQEDKILTRIVPVSKDYQTFIPVSRRVEKLKKVRVATDL
ncbi:hypothetical protein ONS96_003917 [Cadophora gregata f. sp. sojae]|nr:hypothetical protein ONS96_003917 [Cadophora gregata f. sp. sojae]